MGNMLKNKTLSWLLVILWMSLIFYLSHQPAVESRELSTGITEMIMQAIERIAPNAELDMENVNHFIRKNAHFFAYLVLGILVINALKVSGVEGIRSVVFALTICVFYAISDEVHQLFIPGRSGEVRDVLIDSVGASVGILLYLLKNGKGKAGNDSLTMVEQ